MNIDDELHQLAERIEVPAASPYDDVARGRTRLARRRVAVGGGVVASLAVAAVIGGVAMVGAGGGSTVDDRPVAAAPTASTGPSTKSGPVRPKDDDAALRLWRDVLAEHLDPSGGHLQAVPDNMQGGGDADGGVYLGTKLGWSVPGDPGLGMVQIGVASSKAALDGWWDCAAVTPDPSLDCEARMDTASGTLYYLGERNGTTQLVVEQAADRWVYLNINPLFGNNSEVAVGDLSFHPATLIEAASDSRLRLPQP